MMGSFTSQGLPPAANMGFVNHNHAGCLLSWTLDDGVLASWYYQKEPWSLPLSVSTCLSARSIYITVTLSHFFLLDQGRLL